ncbi:MAG: hypothetical protein IT538_11650 [Variibacter sp.]|nr:hypothetical protein [Variibacter sp.]
MGAMSKPERLRLTAILLVSASALLLAPAPVQAAAANTPQAAPHARASATPRKARAAARKPSRRPPPRHGRRAHGPYGFLPGYRPPHVIAYQDEMRARRRPFYALPVARFHRGRWNGGGFGPCYTYTPIGPVWNCGR